MMQLVIPKPSEDDEESKRITSQQSQQSHHEQEEEQQQHRRTHSNSSNGSVIITATAKAGYERGESTQTDEKDGSSSTVTVVEDDDGNDEDDDGVEDNHSVGDNHSLSFEGAERDHMESDQEEEEEEEEEAEAERPNDEDPWRLPHQTTATFATPSSRNNSWGLLPRIEPQPVGHSPYHQRGAYYPQQYHYHHHNYGPPMMNPPTTMIRNAAPSSTSGPDANAYRGDMWCTSWPTIDGDGQPHMMPTASPSPARPQNWGGWAQRQHDMDVYGLTSPMPARPVLRSFPDDGRDSHDVPIPHATPFFRHKKQDSSSATMRSHNHHQFPHAMTPHLLSPHFSSPSPTPPRIQERRKPFVNRSRRHNDTFRFPANDSQGGHPHPMDFDDEEEEGPTESKKLISTPKKPRTDASRKTATTTASSSSSGTNAINQPSSTTATSSDDEKVSSVDTAKVSKATNTAERSKSEPSVPPSTATSIRKSEINRNDVLCGRGAGTNRHWGNHWFRQLVAQNQPAYAAAGVVQRCNIAADIVKAIRTADPPGRFLKRKDESAKGSDDDENVVFFDIGDEAARAKTSQALREKGSDRKRPSAESEDVEAVRSKKKKKSSGLDDDAATLLARFAAPGTLSPLVSPSHTPSPPSMASYTSYGHDHHSRHDPSAPHTVGSPAFYPLTGNESATSLFGTAGSSPTPASAAAKLGSEGMMEQLSIPQLAEGTDDKEGKPASKPSRAASPCVVDSTEIHDHDVLFGRGGVTNSHAGNRRFRQLVESHQASYLLAPKRQKATIARSIVDAIHALRPCGRFLMPNNNGPGGKGNSWIEVSDERAREKTSQALREKAPEMRRVYWAAKSLVAGSQRGGQQAGASGSKPFGETNEDDGISSPPPPDATGLTESISPVGGSGSGMHMSSFQTPPYHHAQHANPMYGMVEHPPVAPWGVPPGHRTSPPIPGYSHSHSHQGPPTYHPQEHHHHHNTGGAPHSAASSPSSSPPPCDSQPRRSSVEIVTEIGPNDVLCGRGAGVNGHDGNRRFRELVNQYRPRYADSPKMEKATVAADIVTTIRSLNPPGRFLMRVEDGSPPGSRSGPERWVDVGDERAREKTSQALREKAR